MSSDAGSDAASAVALEPGSTQGCLGKDDPSDLFHIEAPAGAGGTLYRVQLTDARDMEVCFMAWDADRVSPFIGFRTACAENKGASLHGWFHVAAGTKAILGVSSYLDHTAEENPYVLELEAVPAEDRYEPNDSLDQAKAIELGAAVRAYLAGGLNGPEMFRDVYRFEAPKSAAIEVALEDVPSNLQPIVELFDADRVRLTGKQAPNKGATVRLEHEARKGGTHYLVIQDWGTRNAGYPRGTAGEGEVAPHLAKPYALTVTVN